MEILFCASECSPFALSGGLGDVMGALPRAISKKNKDVNVSVIIPFYSSISEEILEGAAKVYDLRFKLAWRNTEAQIFLLKREGVSYYFVKNDYYFSRAKTYGEYDDGERFAFFCMAVVNFLENSEINFDIIHANDWQSALTVVYLKTIFKNSEKLKKIRTVFTIHNIEYQGKYSLDILWDVFGMSCEYQSILEFDGCINLMKGALTVCDYITTVSPTYAEEIKDYGISFGLSPIINGVDYKLCGIINGIDYKEFTTESDELYHPFTKRGVKSGKEKNKKFLQTELGLQVNKNKPLFIMITRLVQAKGIDLVISLLDELLECENLQIAILGSGDLRYENALREFTNKYSELKVVIGFDRQLSKRMYAAADFFIMPSKSEPCGLAQMIACSYGTVPIVHSVGGLSDTIRSFDGNDGNGFTFKNYDKSELKNTLKEAIQTYHNELEFEKVRKNALNSSFDWGNSAQNYLAIYNSILNW